MLREALLADPGAPWLALARPMLLRDANQARRHGRWREAAASAGAWLRVVGRPVRRSGPTHG